MKTFVVFFVISVVAVSAISIEDLFKAEWEEFKTRHNKGYQSDIEEGYRMKIFLDNKHKIAKHNSKYEKGLVSFKLELNKYGDWFHHEIVHVLNGFNKTYHKKSFQSYQKLKGAKFVEPANVQLPRSVDWREKGAVTSVKDQGHCGSCWSFSATGALEGQHFRQTGKLVSLSEQNLVDCSGKYGNNGCNGGLMDNAFKYIKENKGLDTESSYPYEGKDDKCHYDPSNSGAEDVGFVDIPEGDEKKLMAAVATVGPISIAIDASHSTFQFYSEGVYYEPECSSTELDHGVLLVGYGTSDKGEDYWIVKNSWGPSWGDEGYIKMARNRNNSCGVASSASYPLV